MKIKNIKIKKKWIILIIIILLIIGYFSIKQIIKDPFAGYILEKVTRGEVLQEISETGSVQATDNIGLGFKTIGKISKIYVAVGDKVNKGDMLVTLDESQLIAQLQSARAALDSANSQYDKLLNGLTPDDIKAYQNAVISAQQDLSSTYNGSLNTLNNAYTSIYNAYTTALTIQNDYFSGSDQEGINVQNARIGINTDVTNAKADLQSAKDNFSNQSVDNAVANIIKWLNDTYNSLKIIRDQCDQGVYYSSVTSTDKTAIDTQKTNIYTVLTSVTTLQQNIASYKIALKKAEDALASKEAKPRQEDIDVARSSIVQAQANVNALQSQINDNSLVSPMDGTITEVNAKRGEIISMNESVINLLSSNPFQIKVDIYEQDIVNVRPNNLVKINLVAFPKQIFEGKVLSIDPAEKIVDNVVYYQVTIDFPNQPEGIRSGMTADIVIQSNKKENTLRIPKNAVEVLDDKEIVQIINNKKIESREIVIGLEGSDYYEVLSGLNEGDLIVMGTK